MKKDIGWLISEIDQRVEAHKETNPYKIGVATGLRSSLFLIDQLDEPEVLSREWIDSSSVYIRSDGVTEEYVHVDDLKKLIVPKQEEADQAYKDGYEKGKEHAMRDDEPETVASVMADFLGAAERLKEVLTMEVEELEENDND